MSPPIRVLCVDDSALVRQLLTHILDSDPGIEVVGVAPDPLVAREKIKRLDPDVLTLDIEMPKMDGLSFLEKLMRLRPMPVVMLSTLTQKGAEVSLRALEMGAVEVVPKPTQDLARVLPELSETIISAVKAAASARVRGRAPRSTSTTAPPTEERALAQRLSVDEVVKRKLSARAPGGPPIIAIGASTGGTEAIRQVLEGLPANLPPIAITQHIPPKFSGPFAARLDQTSALTVREAVDGMALSTGMAVVAPGGQHLGVERRGSGFVARVFDGPRVNRHQPSVDVLFRTVAQEAGSSAIGVLLTGMGDDGARGLLELREAGAPTIAQDEASSVVWGMPGEAVRLGGAVEVLGLDQVGRRLVALSLPGARRAS